MGIREKPVRKQTPDNLLVWRERIRNGLERALGQELSGHLTTGLFLGISMDYLHLAMIDYYLDEPVEVVREELALSAEHELKLWQLQVQGSLRGTNGLYPFIQAQRIAGALVAGRWDLAEALARIMDDAKAAGLYRPGRSISYYDAYGWLLKHLVLEEDDQATAMAHSIIDHRRKAKKDQFVPLAQMALALIHGDGEGLAQAMRDYLVVHDRLAKRGGWGDTADGMMCFPAMAFTVLARQRGVPVDVKDPYLFLDLLE